MAIHGHMHMVRTMVTITCKNGPYPTASAGAILWAAKLRGKLKGDTMETAPIGNRRVMARNPVDLADISIGAYSPALDENGVNEAITRIPWV